MENKMYQKLMSYDKSNYIIYNFKDVYDIVDMIEYVKDIYNQGKDLEGLYNKGNEYAICYKKALSDASGMAKDIINAIDKFDTLYNGIMDYIKKNNDSPLKDLDKDDFNEYSSLIYDPDLGDHFQPCVEIPFSNDDRIFTLILREYNAYAYICDAETDFDDAYYYDEVYSDSCRESIYDTIKSCFKWYDDDVK